MTAMVLQWLVNRVLDGLPRRRTVIAGRSWDSYFLWINTGVVIGTAVIFVLAAMRDLSLVIVAAIVAMVAALSLSLFRSKKLPGSGRAWRKWAVRGVYHFQILALIFIVAFLRITGQPVLAYLDILVVGMLVYQAFGRIGCFMAGCCHGRPHAWGVRYGARHAETGYVFFQRGDRLFPIQLFESLWLFMLAGVAIANLVREAAPGENISWYVVGYGIGRFTFEFARGDLRPYRWFGFSEPQWTALLLTIIVCGVERAGVLPFHVWHIAAAFAMTGTIATVMWQRRGRRRALNAAAAHGSLETLDSTLRAAGLTPASGDPALYVRRD
jgi:prolipoprotein diacylglyceryltransferase